MHACASDRPGEAVTLLLTVSPSRNHGPRTQQALEGTPEANLCCRPAEAASAQDGLQNVIWKFPLELIIKSDPNGGTAEWLWALERGLNPGVASSEPRCPYL